MMIHVKNVNTPFAIGLRWLVATYAEIDYLKDRNDLEYGFIHALRERSKKNYKSAALTSLEHHKAVSLAGILSQKYEHLILVHKIQSDFYWVCVIKYHEVWNEIDVGDKTAGDFLCNREKAMEILQIAKAHFSESDINISNFMFATTPAEEDFSSLTPIKLTDLLTGTSKYGKYRIHVIHSHRKQVNKFITLAVIAIVSSIAVYYVYQTQNDEAQARAAQLRDALRLQQQFEQKMNYIQALNRKLYNQQGAKVIHQFQSLLSHLSFQSSGWMVTSLSYAANQPGVMQMTLARGPYGDVLSFHQAFADVKVSEALNADNNSGLKTVKLADPQSESRPSAQEEKNYAAILTSQMPMQRYRLIAYAQNHQANITVSEKTDDQYHFSKSIVTVSGNDLWNLRKFEYIFASFPTLVINQIRFTISTDRTIVWQLEGEIYG